jgi:hypothetical protein
LPVGRLSSAVAAAPRFRGGVVGGGGAWRLPAIEIEEVGGSGELGGGWRRSGRGTASATGDRRAVGGARGGGLLGGGGGGRGGRRRWWSRRQEEKHHSRE